MVEFIEPSWLEQHLNDPSVRTIDPRTPVKYLAGHIPGAVNLPMGKVLDQKTLEVKPLDVLTGIMGGAGIDNNASVVLYDDFDGQNAAMLAWVLEYLGHRKVGILSRRMEAWGDEGREVLYKPVKPQLVKFEAKPDSKVRAQWEELVKPSGVRILDLRSEEEFQGKVATEVRTGHLPRAVNMPWTSLIGDVNSKEFFQPNQNLKEAAAKLGIGPVDNIVTYCSYGPRAAVGYLALRQVGCRNVRVYDGSFHQWAQRAELPVEGEGLQIQM